MSRKRGPRKGGRKEGREGGREGLSLWLVSEATLRYIYMEEGREGRREGGKEGRREGGETKCCDVPLCVCVCV